MSPAPRLLLLVGAGGAAGALLRHGLGVWAPDDGGWPTTTFTINVVGTLLLALLPAVPAVRRSEAWTATLGPGLLGGFTTLSAYAEQSRALLADGREGLAAAYVLATLAACWIAVLLAHAVVARPRETA